MFCKPRRASPMTFNTTCSDTSCGMTSPAGMLETLVTKRRYGFWALKPVVEPWPRLLALRGPWTVLLLGTAVPCIDTEPWSFRWALPCGEEVVDDAVPVVR